MSVTSEPASAAGMCVAPGDDVRNDAAFPAGKTDGNADLSEQLDLRRDNSWTQKIEEISTPELADRSGGARGRALARGNFDLRAGMNACAADASARRPRARAAIR